MKIALIYFSPTGSTARIAEVIKNELVKLKVNVEELDITEHSKRQKKVNFAAYDGIFFGFPIYAWRAPKPAREWLETLEGDGKKCSVFFTYGGVTTGAASSNIQEILTNQHFKLISTAEFVAKHTYNIGGWKLMENRPNQEDFEIAKDYIKHTFERFREKEVKAPIFEKRTITPRQLEKIEQMARSAIKPPSRGGAECNLCKICEETCPTGAMNAELGEANKELCLRCFRCFVKCPENALKIEDLYPKFILFTKVEKLTDEELKRKKSKFFL